MRQTFSRYCCNISPRMSCSVKFFEPTVSAGPRAVHPLQTARPKMERNARRSIFMSATVAHQEFFYTAKQEIGGQGHECRWKRSGKDDSIVNHGDTAKNKFAQTARADSGGNGCNA